MTREEVVALKKRVDRAFELMRFIDAAKANTELLLSGRDKCPISVDFGGDDGDVIDASGTLYNLVRDQLVLQYNGTIARCEAELKTLELE